jgi:hypothetical protein
MLQKGSQQGVRRGEDLTVGLGSGQHRLNELQVEEIRYYFLKAPFFVHNEFTIRQRRLFQGW